MTSTSTTSVTSSGRSSASFAVSGGSNSNPPANSGPVKQDSNASSEAVAVNKNDSQQSNTLRNDADQSQTGENHACGRGCKHESAPQSQDARQSQNASNSISQNAESKSFALNASPNVALLNGGHDKCGGCGDGGVRQSSDASSGAFAGNWNSSEQSNDLGQEARQSQEGGSGSCCGKQSQSIDQSQNATNSISQNAEAKSVAVNASPNIAAFNHGSVDQASGASDGVYTNAAGMPTYGISGEAIDRDDIRAHGKDERIKQDSFYHAVEFYYQLLKSLTNQP